MFHDIEKPKRGAPRRGCSCGCLIAAISLFVLLGGIAVLLIFPAGGFVGDFINSINRALGTYEALGIEIAPAPGDASAYDPIAALPEVIAFAGEGARFVAMQARYVRSDGTLELTAQYSPAPTVEYRFVREVPRPADAPPPGVAGAGSGPWYEPITVILEKPGILRHVMRMGGGVNIQTQYITQGMRRSVGSLTGDFREEFAPLPSCPLAQLWGTALERGADREAVATIEYDARGYSFDISGTNVALRFDMECRLN